MSEAWTIATLKEHLDDQREQVVTQMNSVREAHLTLLHEAMRNERNLTNQQFKASEEATTTAFAAAESALARAEVVLAREFHEHLIQYRHETELQLASSDKAIAKAEEATEKRFESVNEFRKTLTDQATLFMPRAESIQLHARAAERLDDVQRRLDKAEGSQHGQAALVAGFIAVATFLITLVVVGANLLT